MTMPILRLVEDTTTDAMLIKPAFAKLLDDHREYIRNYEGSKMLPIPSQIKGPCFGDFFLILRNLAIPRGYYRLIMLLNGFTHPSQYVGQIDSIFYPNLDVVEDLMLQFRTGASKVIS